MSESNFFEIWVIYEKPKDYPKYFAVRRQRATAGVIVIDKHVQLTDTLEEARALVPEGLTCLPRFENDDPNIVECWF
jgi:hypothetical protein